jgi:competence protein ComEC
MNTVFTNEEGYCRILTFDLNSKDNGVMGIPELNPADSFLISSIKGELASHVLLDAGKKGQAEKIIIPYLHEQGIDRIDRIILSHMHFDHFGGIIDILNHPEITIGQLIYSPISEYSLENCDVGELNYRLWLELQSLIETRKLQVVFIEEEQVGNHIKIDDELYFDIISTPDESFVKAGERVDLNNLNLVLKLNYREFTALFPGDCGVIQTGSITSSAQYEKVKDVFLLKAAHHGGDESTTPEFIAMCNPLVVIIPCNQLVVEKRPSFISNLHAFSRNGAKVFRSDFYREIEIVTDGRSVHCMGRTDHYQEHLSFTESSLKK